LQYWPSTFTCTKLVANRVRNHLQRSLAGRQFFSVSEPVLHAMEECSQGELKAPIYHGAGNLARFQFPANLKPGFYKWVRRKLNVSGKVKNGGGSTHSTLSLGQEHLNRLPRVIRRWRTQADSLESISSLLQAHSDQCVFSIAQFPSSRKHPPRAAVQEAPVKAYWASLRHHLRASLRKQVRQDRISTKSRKHISLGNGVQYHHRRALWCSCRWCDALGYAVRRPSTRHRNTREHCPPRGRLCPRRRDF
jgi:hypothetical protein